MAINVKCPKCGSEQVQLSNEMSKHGCLYFVLFGWLYLIWLVIRWVIALVLLVCYDWWMAIVKASAKKGHVWLSKRWFVNRRRVFYCHACGHNFRG